MQARGCTARRAAWLGLSLFVACALPAVADTSISASVAGMFVGQERIVEDTVTAGERDASTVRLRLGRAPQHLTVSLVLGLVNDFPPEPERYYVGKTVRVAGMIQSFRGAPEVVVRDVADIHVVEAGLAPGRPASNALGGADEASTQERLNALGERVRTLEERVQQLERSRARPEIP
jgi:hypothetical protein